MPTAIIKGFDTIFVWSHRSLWGLRTDRYIFNTSARARSTCKESHNNNYDVFFNQVICSASRNFVVKVATHCFKLKDIRYVMWMKMYEENMVCRTPMMKRTAILIHQIVIAFLTSRTWFHFAASIDMHFKGCSMQLLHVEIQIFSILQPATAPALECVINLREETFRFEECVNLFLYSFGPSV